MPPNMPHAACRQASLQLGEPFAYNVILRFGHHKETL
jgi:hypothetical protein